MAFADALKEIGIVRQPKDKPRYTLKQHSRRKTISTLNIKLLILNLVLLLNMFQNYMVTLMTLYLVSRIKSILLI